MRWLVSLAVLAGCSAAPVDVLVFSRTLGFRHTSIPDGIAAVQAMGATGELRVQATEDPAVLADPTGFGVLLFLSTSGDVLDDTQQKAVEAWAVPGHGFMGVHSASNTEYDWPFYGQLLGAWFRTHPAIQTANLLVEDGAHPATVELPATWSHEDEWYEYLMTPRGKVHVLLRVDESTYVGGTMGDHPIAWCHTPGGVRVFYTALGHPEAAWHDPTFLAHIEGGLRWTAGLASGDCPAP